MSAIQAIQAPIRMKDLVAEQRAAYKSLRHNYVAMELHLKMERNKNRILYHMRVSALAKKQAEEKAALRQQAKEEKALRQQAKEENAAIRQQVKEEKTAIRQQAKEENAAIYQQVKAALREQAKADKAELREQLKADKAALRQQAKAEKDAAKAALREQALGQSMLPQLGMDHPNYGGRRHTMTLVLKSLSLPEMSEEHMDKLMIAYAEWLLTSTHGRKCRWSLMTAFATERLVV